MRYWRLSAKGENVDAAAVQRVLLSLDSLKEYLPPQLQQDIQAFGNTYGNIGKISEYPPERRVAAHDELSRLSLAIISELASRSAREALLPYMSALGRARYAEERQAIFGEFLAKTGHSTWLPGLSEGSPLLSTIASLRSRAAQESGPYLRQTLDIFLTQSHLFLTQPLVRDLFETHDERIALEETVRKTLQSYFGEQSGEMFNEFLAVYNRNKFKTSSWNSLLTALQLLLAQNYAPVRPLSADFAAWAVDNSADRYGAKTTEEKIAAITQLESLIQRALNLLADHYQVGRPAAPTRPRWTNSRSRVEQKAQEVVGDSDLARMPIKVRFADLFDRIERFFQYMQLNMVSLWPERIITLLNNPSLTKPEDIFGLTYEIVGRDGTVIKTGQIKKNTVISFPATVDYSLTIGGLTIAGADILAKYPQYQTWSRLEATLLWSIFIASVSMFGLGQLTQSWTLIDSILKTHTSIYYVFQDRFGTNVANVILGQFKDLSTYTIMFSWFILSSESFVRRAGTWLALLPLSVMPLFSIYLEFVQANLRGDYADVPDILAFSVIPLTTVTYGTYSFIRHIRRSKNNPATFSDNRTSAAMAKQSVRDTSSGQKKQLPDSAFVKFLNANFPLINIGIFGALGTAAVWWLVTVIQKHHLPYTAYILPASLSFIVFRIVFDLLKLSSVKLSITSLTEFFRRLFSR